jgi:hypothetical protein
MPYGGRPAHPGLYRINCIIFINGDIFLKGCNVYKDRTDACVRRYVKITGG